MNDLRNLQPPTRAFSFCQSSSVQCALPRVLRCFCLLSYLLSLRYSELGFLRFPCILVLLIMCHLFSQLYHFLCGVMLDNAFSFFSDVRSTGVTAIMSVSSVCIFRGLSFHSKDYRRGQPKKTITRTDQVGTVLTIHSTPNPELKAYLIE